MNEGLNRLLDDARNAVVAGSLLLARGFYRMGKYVCPVAAAWLAHHNFQSQPNVRMGHWAMEYYNLSWDEGQGLIDGWDGVERRFESVDYTLAYNVAQDAYNELA